MCLSADFLKEKIGNTSYPFIWTGGYAKSRFGKSADWAWKDGTNWDYDLWGPGILQTALILEAN